MSNRQSPQVQQLTDQAANRRLQRQLWTGTAAVLILVVVVAALVSWARPVAESVPPVPVHPSATGEARCSQEALTRVVDALVYNPHTEEYVIHFHGSAMVPEAVIVSSQSSPSGNPDVAPVPNADKVVPVDGTLRDAADKEGLVLNANEFAGPDGRVTGLRVCRIVI